LGCATIALNERNNVVIKHMRVVLFGTPITYDTDAKYLQNFSRET